MPDGQIPEGHMPKGRMLYSQNQDGQMPEGQMLGGQMLKLSKSNVRKSNVRSEERLKRRIQGQGHFLTTFGSFDLKAYELCTLCSRNVTQSFFVSSVLQHFAMVLMYYSRTRLM